MLSKTIYYGFITVFLTLWSLISTAEDLNISVVTLKALQECQQKLSNSPLKYDYCLAITMTTASNYDPECFTSSSLTLVNDFIEHSQTHPEDDTLEIAKALFSKAKISSTHCDIIQPAITGTTRAVLGSRMAAIFAYQKLKAELLKGVKIETDHLLIPADRPHYRFSDTDALFQPDKITVRSDTKNFELLQGDLLLRSEDVTEAELDYAECPLGHYAFPPMGQRWCLGKNQYSGTILLHPRFHNQTLRKDWEIKIQESLFYTRDFVLVTLETFDQAEAIKAYINEHFWNEFQLVKQASLLGLPLLGGEEALFSHGLLYKRIQRRTTSAAAPR